MRHGKDIVRLVLPSRSDEPSRSCDGSTDSRNDDDVDERHGRLSAKEYLLASLWSK